MFKTLLLFCVFAAGTLVSAEELVFDLDAAQTEIKWTLGDVLHTVHGTFKLKRGSIRLDTDKGTASGQFVVDVTSGESGSGARDHRMHKEILESQKYPDATFVADRVEGKILPDGDSKLAIHGMFTIHGSEHEMTLQAELQKHGEQSTAVTHFVIPYVKWGMKNPSNFLLKVNDHVEVDIKSVVHAHARVG